MVAMKMKLDHGGKIEKEKQIFFLIFLFIWANTYFYILMIS